MVCDNLRHIRSEITRLRRAQSDQDVVLVAVSKAQGLNQVKEAISCGQIAFGENRVQEAMGKFADLKQSGHSLELHLLGPLQTNKVRMAIQLFDVIHSLDRPKLAEAIATESSRQGRNLKCFIQVNTGREPQKAGVFPESLEPFYDYCVQTCRLQIAGLMCIPPVAESPREHFMLLADLANDLGTGGLSMGMSCDYAVAIECGATHIRVGSAIFGSRPQEMELNR